MPVPNSPLATAPVSWRWFVLPAAAALMLLMLAMTVRPAAADDNGVTTFAVSSVAGFETGIVKLAFIEGILAETGLGRPEVRWGDGHTSPGLLSCEGLELRRNCNIYGTHVYESPGNYTIELEYRLAGRLFTRTVTMAATVSPPGDFIIVSIGDSVASGEGNPRLADSEHEWAMWDDPDSNRTYTGVPRPDEPFYCHRSAHAAPASAAAALTAEVDPSKSVTFVHVACSGARLTHHTLNESDLRYQLQSVRDIVPRIDVLLISGGANDVAGGFGNVIKRCVLNPPTSPCSEDQEFAQELEDSMNGLPGRYDSLAQRIDCVHEDANCDGEDHIPSLVVISEYFDPTRNGDGDFPSGAQNLTCVGLAITAAEWEFLYDNMVVPLNAAVASAARAHGWARADGIADAFRTHGYCAGVGLQDDGESWVVRLGQSRASQGDLNGTGHPNLLGMREYRDRLSATTIDYHPPRTTATGTTTSGASYEFGSPTREDVTVTLEAANLILTSGVGQTFYAVDDPLCAPNNLGACSVYDQAAPIAITPNPGVGTHEHTITFFSENARRGIERARTVTVLIERTAPPVDPPGRPDTPGRPDEPGRRDGVPPGPPEILPPFGSAGGSGLASEPGPAEHPRAADAPALPAHARFGWEIFSPVD